jgi:hypothetical protein
MRRVSLLATSSIGCLLHYLKINHHLKNSFLATLTTNFLKNLGVHAFLILDHITHKFSLRSKQCVFLGYSPNHKGYKFYHTELGQMYISRDVLFHETVFPFATPSPLSVPHASTPAPFIPLLHTPAYPTPSVVHPSSPPFASTTSNIPPSPTTKPSMTNSQSMDPAPHTQPMTTRAQNNIV